ncbi:BON domain-containing protein [Trinickia caryophylli]|uniref:BON domain-containing protein n=1 Tax=Trinickia caryophylli TaxID=28094 RepID=UPI001E2F20FF|nr:BON domain-containing protein [Trinickia caryophylli]
MRKQLFSTKGLKSTSITVFAMADTGKVVLAGFIDDASQDQLAADAAKKVPGVNSVTSNLSIREEGS